MFSLYSTETSFAMDTKCAIKSSCSPSGCHVTDPITVNPASNITLNCTIITGELARNMTWNQTLKRVRNSTGTKLSNLVLQQSNSTKSDGKYSCRCTTIKLARKCFLIQPNLVPRAHVPFGQPQDTELWNNQFPETKILGLPASRRMRGLV